MPETRVRRAAEAAGNRGERVSEDAMVGPLGMFLGDAEPPVALVEIAVIGLVNMVLDEPPAIGIRDSALGSTTPAGPPPHPAGHA